MIMGTVKIQVPGPVSVVVPATACELAEGQNIGIVERERVRGRERGRERHPGHYTTTTSASKLIHSDNQTQPNHYERKRKIQRSLGKTNKIPEQIRNICITK